MSADRPARVRTAPEFPGLVISDDGRIQGPSRKWLKAFPDKDGYLRFNTYRNRKWQQHSVHVAVCTAFHGPRPEAANGVRHLNGDPQDNRAENLAWGTYLENEADKRRHGHGLLGERHHQAKLTEDDVLLIRGLRSSGSSLRELSERFGVTLATISSIAHRKRDRKSVV